MKTPLHRLSAWLLGRFVGNLWGFTPGLMPSVVEHLGPLGALVWMARNMPRFERVMKEMGPLSCHVACVVASLLNGCAYCAYAHARSLQLYYLRDRGTLFPIDEHELIGLSLVSDDEMYTRLEQVLTSAGMAEDIPTIRRLRALKLDGLQPSSEDDWRLQHLIQTFDTLNACAINRLVPFDDAHDPINKDTALKDRYAHARMEASQLKS